VAKLIFLNEEKWCKDVECLDLPHNVIGLLMAIVNEHQNGDNRLPAYKHAISLVKEHLSEGIKLGNKTFDIAVYIPKDTKKETSFFTLVQNWGDGDLKKIKDLEIS
jgi:hypothetical protein